MSQAARISYKLVFDTLSYISDSFNNMSCNGVSNNFLKNTKPLLFRETINSTLLWHCHYIFYNIGYVFNKTMKNF